MDLQDITNNKPWPKHITSWREVFPKVDNYLFLQKASAVAKLNKELAEKEQLTSHKTKQLELILNTLKVIDTAKCKTLEAIVNSDNNKEVAIVNSNNEVEIVNSNNRKDIEVATPIADSTKLFVGPGKSGQTM